MGNECYIDIPRYKRGNRFLAFKDYVLQVLGITKKTKVLKAIIRIISKVILKEYNQIISVDFFSILEICFFLFLFLFLQFKLNWKVIKSGKFPKF